MTISWQRHLHRTAYSALHNWLFFTVLLRFFFSNKMETERRQRGCFSSITSFKPRALSLMRYLPKPVKQSYSTINMKRQMLGKIKEVFLNGPCLRILKALAQICSSVSTRISFHADDLVNVYSMYGSEMRGKKPGNVLLPHNWVSSVGKFDISSHICQRMTAS